MATREEKIAAVKRQRKIAQVKQLRAASVEAGPQAPQQQPQSSSPIRLSSNPFAGYESQAKAVTDQARADRERMTPEMETLPRFSQIDTNPDSPLPSAKDFRMALMMLTTPGDAERQKILKKIDPAFDFRQDEKGNTIVIFPDGQEAVLNRPGADFGDALTFGAEAAKFAPAARMASAAVGIPAKALTGAIGAGVTETGNQVAQRLQGGDINLGEMAFAASLGAGVELAMPVLRNIWGRLNPELQSRFAQASTLEEIRKLGVASQDELRQLQQATLKGRESVDAVKEMTGIAPGLFKAQMTLNPSDLSKQRLLRQLDPSAAKAASELAAQNERLFEIAQSIVNKVAPESAIEGAGAGVRDAARAEMRRTVDMPLLKRIDETLEAIATPDAAAKGPDRARKAANLTREQAVEIREQVADPIYNRAYNENPKIDYGPIRSLANRFLARFKEGNSARNAVAKVQKLVSDDVREIPASGLVDQFGRRASEATVERIPPTLRQLHDARMEIDNLIKFDGKSPLSINAREALVELRATINAQLSKASKTFREADKKFAELSRPIDEIDESALGAVGRREDATIAGAADDLLSSGRWTPEQVARARAAMERSDPGSWAPFYRSYLDSKLGALDSAGATPREYIKALFPNDQTTKALIDNAPDAASRRNLMRLKADLERAVQQYGETRIGRIAQLGDGDLDRAATEIFGGQATPSEIASLRKVIESQGGPETWNAIVRREIYNRMNGIATQASDQGADQIQNLPGKLLSAMFGNPNQRERLLRSTDGEMRKNLLFLEDVLRRGAAGRAEGSPTTPFKVILDSLRGSLGVARDMVRQPVQKMASVGEGSLLNRRIAALADAMFDPRFAEEMAAIRRLGPTSNQAADRFERLVIQASKTGARASVQAARGQSSEPIPGANRPNINVK